MSSALPPARKYQKEMTAEHQPSFRYDLSRIEACATGFRQEPYLLIRQPSIMELAPAGRAGACEIQSIQVTVLSDVPYSTCTRLPRSQVGGMWGRFSPINIENSVRSFIFSYKMFSKYFLGPSSWIKAAQNGIMPNSFDFGELRGRTRPPTLKPQIAVSWEK